MFKNLAETDPDETRQGENSDETETVPTPAVQKPETSTQVDI